MKMSKRRTNKPIRQTQSIQTLLDIIIPVYNRADLLSKCLQSIPWAVGDIPYRVYVFDNGSNPQNRTSIDALARQYNVKVTHSKDNLGFPRACNLAVKSSYSPLIFFLNDDIVLAEGSLVELVKTMDNPEIGVAGMLLTFPKDSDRKDRPAGMVQHVGISTNIRGELYHHFIGWNPNNPRVQRVTNVYGVTGAALMTRRKLYTSVGGFFEGYGLGTFEDIDYCLTAYKAGYKIVVNTKATAEHYAGATAVSEQIQYPLDINKHIFMQRWQRELYYSEWEIL